MEPETTGKPRPGQERVQAVQHVSEAHHILKTLQKELDQHPGLEEAIRKLEMALSILTVKTGGML
jgi:hypothetical protein